jgi:hypothetical protein
MFPFLVSGLALRLPNTREKIGATGAGPASAQVRGEGKTTAATAGMPGGRVGCGSGGPRDARYLGFPTSAATDPGNGQLCRGASAGPCRT